MQVDHLIIDANIATMNPKYGKGYGHIEKAALAIKAGRIVFLGSMEQLPKEIDLLSTPVTSAKGQWLTPGLIDCHTHLVFAGNRASEFERRLEGESYQSIAASGGGIATTVKATREASREQLFVSAKQRLNALFREGVTTVEVKSGYGLDTDSELKILAVAQLLQTHHPVDVHSTFLGAHALPPEYKDDAQGYIDLVCEQMLPQIAQDNLASAVDVFCESVGFSLAHTEQVFAKAQQLGLRVKLHGEQLSNMGGSALAAKYQALSSDHLEYLDEAGIMAMKKADMTAVLLPGAFYYLREAQLPPLAMLAQHQVPIALATDFNPGTSPLCSLQLMMNMACTLWQMTPEQSLAGVTRNAAKALGLSDRGMLGEGMRADLALWNIEHPAQLSYEFGLNPLDKLWVAGEMVKS